MKEMTEKEFDLEFSSMTEEEIDKMLDDAVLSIGEMILEEESKTSIINPQRIKEILITYNTLKFLAKGTGAKVTCKLHDEFHSVGTVSVMGRNVTFNHSEWFVKACQLASNIDIYPRTDNKVRLDLTFYGLTKPIE